MTSERIELVVRRLKAIAATGFSDYAGFHLEKNSKSSYQDCFIVNNQEFHSSNLTLELENFNDAVEIIKKFTGKNEKEVLDDLEYSDYNIKDQYVYLHYLKLIKDCED